jgi:DNA-binding NarL/FixJ family response regulator
MITVLVVDDNPTVRATLRPLLESDPGISVVAEAANGQAALAAARRLRPRVTLLDYRMPIADGLSVIEAVAQHSSVLVLTGSTDLDLIAPMLRGGACGYLVYGQFDPADLVLAVRAVSEGQGWLTPAAARVATSAMRDAYARERAAVERSADQRTVRMSFGLSEREREVIDLVCDGLSNAAIADRLGLSEKTVKNHLHRIFAKLDVGSRTGAIVRWQGRPGELG